LTCKVSINILKILKFNTQNILSVEFLGKNKSKFIIIKMKATIVTIGDEILIGQMSIQIRLLLPNLWIESG
jgi:hypothetical protein